MSKWILQRKAADYKGLSEKLKVDPVIVRLMVNRGLSTYEEMEEYLHPTLDNFSDPHLFADMDEACGLLMDAIDEGVKIRVVGDYDVDGIMSTYILTSAIKEVGGDVDYAVPHRMVDGYGINPEMVQAAFDEGVRFIITCDNGIAAAPAVDLAKELGMTFVVTDHHEVPFETGEDGSVVQKLPNADAVVDPKRNDCGYPFKGICGAQVAWKLVDVLFEFVGLDKEMADKYLQFASIATVCDVMELKGENRATVYHGLKAIENTDNVGLNALLARNELKGKPLSCYHLGFIIGPCLNASGRLDTASKAIELLFEEDSAKALASANELVELNSQRKNMTQIGIDKARDIIENSDIKNQKVLVVYIPELHESLAGIVAGRIRETYNKPVLVITDAEDGAKGSGRSIPAYNMFEELTAVKDVFTKFGGHPMAAGVSLPTDKIDELRDRLNSNCKLTEDDMQEIIKIDCDMPLSYMTESLVDSIDMLAPFGTGNTKPLFALKNVEIKGASFMGKEGQFLRLNVGTENGGNMTALMFRNVLEFQQAVSDKYGEDTLQRLFSGNTIDVKMDIIYEPSINEYRGSRSIQIMVENFK
ncbi:exonuclease RecJ [Pseudobutyrivibrio sp. NOR37]|uniref:Single-stranded-DNA-specific exonuclease RecJ n=1 Tax=Pseudobutyrivibrio xylanivorans TaxID=185007 RepID=A0A6M0LEQ2_PSEXY|nr:MULTISPECIES: single-stranded-DNA-specific exonuclease RecJ [Pseudobutyrivibrio]NEX00610.1 single-stranded-DNA-specific exonuclease RecJ [Pseudobutyrivibrio xylanivorans]SFR61447.1 exonuclease RecJ [Pseudobutyrivibrio sp. NOR37]